VGERYEDTGCEDVDWILLAQYRVQWRAVVNAVMNLKILCFLTTWALSAFQERLCFVESVKGLLRSFLYNSWEAFGWFWYCHFRNSPFEELFGPWHRIWWFKRRSKVNPLVWVRISEADHSPPSSAEVNKAWSYTSTPPICLHGVVLSSAQGQLCCNIYVHNWFKSDEMGGTCSMYGRNEKCVQYLKWTGHLGWICVHRRIILKWILNI